MTTGGAHHPALDLLARYRAVFRAAWAQRHDMAGPRRLADEAAFLPAALSLQETPVHPAPRRAAIAICALFCVALAWSIVCEVDVVAVAQGRIMVSDRTKVLQPLEAGVVKAIHVKDGDHVRRGQLLIELDATQPQADAARLAQERLSAESEALRSQALLSALSKEPPTTPSLPAAWPVAAADRTSAQTQLQTEWADIQAKLAKLAAEVAHRHAEEATADEVIAKLEVSLPLVRQREADFRTLTDQGFMSSHGTQDRTRERIEVERDLSTARARRAEAQAALVESLQGRASYVAETQRTLRQRLADAELRRSQAHEESIKASQRTRQTLLSAPADGVVQQLAVHTNGGVVTPAQQLLVLVPDEAALTAEVMLENKDIGFVREGQAAAIKLDTFPFTRYGTIPATVLNVGSDAVVDDKRGAVFPVALGLARTHLKVDGHVVPIAPGMNVNSEIAVGRRTLIRFVLDPVMHHLDESGRER